MKRAEFHQATITAQIRIVDDNRSYGLKTAQVLVLVDKEHEWMIATCQIQDAIDKITDELQHANSH